MFEYQLDYPVYTHEKEVLFPAGIKLTETILMEHIEADKTEYPSMRVLEFDTIRPDILRMIHNPPYKQIYSDKDQLNALLETIEKVELPIPVLHALNHFKKVDFYTYRHILMVFALSALLAIILSDDHKSLTQDIIACPTHDIGKISIPIDILIKRTPLTQSEYNQLKHHTIAGYALMCHYYKDLNNISAVGARDHHERKNGSGYPTGKCVKNKIVDIIIVSDLYDALISPRPYRPVSFENRTALEELTWMTENGEISKEVVKVLVSNNRMDRPNYKECQLSLERRGAQPVMNSYGKRIDDSESAAG